MSKPERRSCTTRWWSTPREDEHGNMKFYYAVCTEFVEARARTGPIVRPGDCDYDEQRTFPPSEG